MPEVQHGGQRGIYSLYSTPSIEFKYTRWLVKMMVLISFHLHPTSETKSGDRGQIKLNYGGVPRVGNLNVTCTGLVKENWVVTKDDGA